MNHTKKPHRHLLVLTTVGALFSGIAMAEAISEVTSESSAETTLFHCVELIGCERKICEKETELEEAKSKGNVAKILGLKKSLERLNKSCINDPEEYKVNHQKLLIDYQNDLDEAMSEYNDDLVEARSEGKPEKIRQAKEKYDIKVKKLKDEYKRQRESLL